MTKIVKSKKNLRYTTIHNFILANEKLSLQAKGLYCYIVSLPEDWVIYKSEIMKHHSNGRAAFETAWQELEEAGYLVGADQVRKDGKFMGRDYVFYDLTDDDKQYISDGPPMLKISNGDESALEVSKPQILEKNVDNQTNLPMQEISNGTDAENQQLLKKQNTTNKTLQRKGQLEISERKQNFKEQLVPYIDKYGLEMLKAFSKYWTELNLKKTKMRFEMQDAFEIPKRLATWKSRAEEKVMQPRNGQPPHDTPNAASSPASYHKQRR